MTAAHGLQRLVFIGDSITDSGRDRSNPTDLGTGYVSLLASMLEEEHQHPRHMLINRGVSGDRAADVEARWAADCLDLSPDVITLLVGVNDTWRRFDSADPTSIEDYAASIDAVLASTRECSDARLMLMEPFVLHVAPVTSEWDEELSARQAVVADAAARFGATLVALQGAFHAAARETEPAALLRDGVHPTGTGYAVIARAWREAF
jgi:acyl-CoA thioesterase I